MSKVLFSKPFENISSELEMRGYKGLYDAYIQFYATGKVSKPRTYRGHSGLASIETSFRKLAYDQFYE